MASGTGLPLVGGGVEAADIVAACSIITVQKVCYFAGARPQLHPSRWWSYHSLPCVMCVCAHPRAGLSSCRRDCHSAAPPSICSRCFNSDGDRPSVK